MDSAINKSIFMYVVHLKKLCRKLVYSILKLFFNQKTFTF